MIIVRFVCPIWLCILCFLITGLALDECTNGSSEEDGYCIAPTPRNKTLIALSVFPNFFTDIFIKGGFTAGNESRCVGRADINPCSIPVTHIIPIKPPKNYQIWAEGDNYLDLGGSEPLQGEYKGEVPLGTPMRKLDKRSAQEMLHLMKVDYNMQYWVVELNMDCTKTDGYFEFEGIVVTKKKQHLTETEETKLKKERKANPKKIKPPKAIISPLNNDEDQREIFPTSVKEVDQFAKKCQGSVPMSIPYQSLRHIGLCGKINIFTFKTDQCTIKEL